MGLFSKKTIVCDKCGKEYETRNSFGVHICAQCQQRDSERRDNVRGYLDYAMKISLNSYSDEEMDAIAVHRNEVFERCRVNGISAHELANASDNYKKLTDEQAADILIRTTNASLEVTDGAAFGSTLFALTDFQKVVVAASDVFAVGYTSDYNNRNTEVEVIKCIIFTNDPYIPVFCMHYVGKLGFFELMKSKKGRQGVSALFEIMCPNLKYPVQDLDKLKKKIKQEGCVNGNIEYKKMLDMISYSSVWFDSRTMVSYLDPGTKTMLSAHGFILSEDINKILKMDKMFNRNYWNKQMKRLNSN